MTNLWEFKEVWYCLILFAISSILVNGFFIYDDYAGHMAKIIYGSERMLGYSAVQIHDSITAKYFPSLAVHLGLLLAFCCGEIYFLFLRIRKGYVSSQSTLLFLLAIIPAITGGVNYYLKSQAPTSISSFK